MALVPTGAAQTQVDGHTRRDGTYVAPHYRSSPDKSLQQQLERLAQYQPVYGRARRDRPTFDDRPPSPEPIRQFHGVSCTVSLCTVRRCSLAPTASRTSAELPGRKPGSEPRSIWLRLNVRTGSLGNSNTSRAPAGCLMALIGASSAMAVNDVPTQKGLCPLVPQGDVLQSTDPAPPVHGARGHPGQALSPKAFKATTSNAGVAHGHRGVPMAEKILKYAKIGAAVS